MSDMQQLLKVEEIGDVTVECGCSTAATGVGLNDMNKTVFAVICVACVFGSIAIVFLALIDAFPRRDLVATIFLVLVVLPAIAWLRLRIEGRRKRRDAEFETMVMQAQAQAPDPEYGLDKTSANRRRLRRCFVAVGMLAVGLCLTFVAPHQNRKDQQNPIGWIMALLGGILLLGELMGRNILRKTALDSRLDSISSQKNMDDQRRPG